MNRRSRWGAHVLCRAALIMLPLHRGGPAVEGHATPEPLCSLSGGGGCGTAVPAIPGAGICPGGSRTMRADVTCPSAPLPGSDRRSAGRSRPRRLSLGALAGCAVLAAAILPGCGGGGGSTSPVAGGGTTAHGGSSSGLQTAKPGQVLTGAQVTGSTTLTPVPGTLTGWDDSLSVKTGTTDGVGTYAAAKGQRFVVADLSFGSGEEARIAQGAGTDAGGPYGFTFGSAGRGNDLTVTVTADGRTTPITLASNLQDQPIAVSTAPGQPVMLGWKDGTTSGAIDLTTGQVTSPTPAALGRTNVFGRAGGPAIGETTPLGGKEGVLVSPVFLSYFDQGGTVVSPSPSDAELVAYLYPSAGGSVDPITATLTVNGATAPETSGNAAWSKNLSIGASGATNGGDGGGLQVDMFTVPADFSAGTLTMTADGGTATLPVTVPAG